MEKLQGRNYKDIQQHFEEHKSNWQNVNISMKTRFLNRLDKAVEASSYSSRSRFVRKIISKELSMEENF